jgi:hypothetical protein
MANQAARLKQRTETGVTVILMIRSFAVAPKLQSNHLVRIGMELGHCVVGLDASCVGSLGLGHRRGGEHRSEGQRGNHGL